MINKIITSTFFIFLLFSISLYAMGVRAPIELGVEFRIFVARCSQEFEEIKFSIPKIPYFNSLEESTFVLGNNPLEYMRYLIAQVDILRNFFNALVMFINFLTSIIDFILQLFEFLYIVLKNFITFRDRIVATTPIV